MTGRLPRPRPGELDPARREVYAAITTGRRSAGPQSFPLVDGLGRLEGPYNAFLLQPRLGLAVQDLGSAIRYETSLSGRIREIAILLVAVHEDSSFEWFAHRAVGQAVGLTEAELDAVRGGGSLGRDRAERTVVELVRGLLSAGDLSDAEYSAAVEVLGETSLFEILSLVGYYRLLALQLRVFRVSPPEEG